MLTKYIRGKTEKEIDKQQQSKREKRSLYINESFNNIKTVKLFGWEPDFLAKVDAVFQEELEIEDRQQLRGKVYDFLDHLTNSMVTIVVLSVYVWLGNSLTLSKMTLVQLMLRRIRDRINHSEHLYR